MLSKKTTTRKKSTEGDVHDGHHSEKETSGKVAVISRATRVVALEVMQARTNRKEGPGQ